MDIEDKIIELYSAGLKPAIIADRLKLDPVKVRGKVQQLRKKGVITNYTRNKADPYYVESTARKIYVQKKLKSGTMSQLLDMMSPEIQDHYIDLTINGGYESIAEAFADILIDRYFEGKIL